MLLTEAQISARGRQKIAHGYRNLGQPRTQALWCAIIVCPSFVHQSSHLNELQGHSRISMSPAN